MKLWRLDASSHPESCLRGPHWIHTPFLLGFCTGRRQVTWLLRRL